MFYSKHDVEVIVSYGDMGAETCKLSKHRNRLFRLFNFINGELRLGSSEFEGEYDSQIFYLPRIYLPEYEESEIIFSTIINYDFWEAAPMATCRYITGFCVEFADMVAYPIFALLHGNCTFEEAMNHLKEKVSFED